MSKPLIAGASLVLLVVGTVAIVRAIPAPRRAAPTEPTAGWRTHSNEFMQLDAPETCVPDWRHDPKTGIRMFIGADPSGLVVSLCATPVTTMHLVDDDMKSRDTARIAPIYRATFALFKDRDVELEPVAGADGELALKSPRHTPLTCCAGRVWREPEAGWLLFLLVIAPDVAAADRTLARLRPSVRMLHRPLFALSRGARSLEADIPGGWELALEDDKKRYWLSEDGNAYFMISKGTPNPFAETRTGYGTEPDMARLALTTAENLSGRKAQVSSSEILFDDRLFVRVSRALGTVEHKSGSFVVQMETWYDPRLEKTVRVYLGGRKREDFERALAIRQTLRIERP